MVCLRDTHTSRRDKSVLFFHVYLADIIAFIDRLSIVYTRSHRHEMDELIFDDHQLTFRAVRSPLFSAQAPLHIWPEICYIYVLSITGAAVSILTGLQKFSWHDPIARALIVSGFILISSEPTDIFIQLAVKRMSGQRHRFAQNQ